MQIFLDWLFIVRILSGVWNIISYIYLFIYLFIYFILSLQVSVNYDCLIMNH